MSSRGPELLQCSKLSNVDASYTGNYGAGAAPRNHVLQQAQTQRTLNFFSESESEFRLEIGENFCGREAAIFALQNSLEYDSIAN